MCNNSPKYTIHAHQSHYGWDNTFSPVQTVAPGDTLEFLCEECSGGQITAHSTTSDLAQLDFARINPVCGPIYIDGAEPGDVVKITFENFAPSGFGWTANIPGFGLLADDFQDPALKLWQYCPDKMGHALYNDVAKVPLKPFAGTVGLAPAENGLHSVVPPRRVGGNMDIRDLSTGCILYLPVEVPGALFSIGDTHAAQGDGEVCGTAIESQFNVTLTLDLIKNTPLAMPRFTTPGPVTRHLDTHGYEVTTGIADDLMAGAKMAVANMIDLLCATHHLNPIDAYMLCSVCGDLRISEIVDHPNWTVSFYFPRSVIA